MVIVLLDLTDLHLSRAKSAELFSTAECNTISQHNRKHMHNQGLQYKRYIKYSKRSQNLTCFENSIRICLEAS